MFSNCYKYNPPDHDVVAMARKLQVLSLIYKLDESVSNSSKYTVRVIVFGT